MGLDFTNIPDREGAALYFLYDTVTQQHQMERLANELHEMKLSHQIVLVPARDANGEKICSFYSLSHGSMPYILLISDNDELVASWSGLEMPAADIIAYTARSASQQ
jgi:hypothetical protein